MISGISRRKNILVVRDSHGNLVDMCPDMESVHESAAAFGWIGVHIVFNKETGDDIAIHFLPPHQTILRRYNKECEIVERRIITKNVGE